MPWQIRNMTRDNIRNKSTGMETQENSLEMDTNQNISKLSCAFTVASYDKCLNLASSYLNWQKRQKELCQAQKVSTSTHGAGNEVVFTNGKHYIDCNTGYSKHHTRIKDINIGAH